MECRAVVLAVLIALQLSFTGVKAADGDTNSLCKANDTCTATNDTCETIGNAKKCKTRAGQTCTALENCIANAPCFAAGQPCTCITGYAPNTGNTKCLKKIGQNCTVNSNNECMETAAACTATGSLVCTCPADKTANSDMTKCLAKVGTTCTANADCVANAECPATGTKTCACNTGYLALKDITACRQKLNETCAASSTTCGENAECATLKCACLANFTADTNGRCGKKSGETCTSDSECVTDATCTGTTTKTCTCKTEYVANTSKFCEKTLPVSESAGVSASILMLMTVVVTSLLL